MNEKYVLALKEFTTITTNPSEYFIVGSVGLLSYTKPVGYDREIHDVDIIMEVEEARRISKKLIELGYTKNTFINKRMPFYNKLNKLANDRYLRFSKDGVDIEILATTLREKGGYITFEIYPHIKARLPREVFTISSYSGIEFSTVSKEMLYYFKKIANNTVGRKVKYKEEQRLKDIQNLERIIDKQAFLELTNKCKLCIRGFCFKLPIFLFN